MQADQTEPPPLKKRGRGDTINRFGAGKARPKPVFLTQIPFPLQGEGMRVTHRIPQGEGGG
jgi:hypothetical protein